MKTTTRTVLGVDYELREYDSLGKYEGGLAIDPFVDNSDWSDAEAGDVETIGYHMLIRGGFTDDQFVDAGADVVDNGQFREVDGGTDVTESERDFLKAIAGAIVRCYSQGFVTVAYYDTDVELMKDWGDIEALELRED